MYTSVYMSGGTFCEYLCEVPKNAPYPRTQTCIDRCMANHLHAHVHTYGDKQTQTCTKGSTLVVTEGKKATVLQSDVL